MMMMTTPTNTNMNTMTDGTLIRTVNSENEPDIETKRQMAEQRRDRAVRMAKKLEELEARKREELFAQMNQNKLLLDKTINDAKRARKQALEFLKESKRKHESRMTEQNKPKEEFQVKRTKSLNQLSRNIDRTRSIIRAINEQKEKKREREEALLREQMAIIANQGGNPHEILRERRERERVKNMLAQVKRRQDEKREEILKRLDFEQSRELKQREMENEKRIIQREYSKQVHSQVVREQKLSAYIQSRTMTGTSIIDPLGRETQLFPSALMDPSIRERRYATELLYKTVKQKPEESPFDDFAFRRHDLRDSSDEDDDGIEASSDIIKQYPDRQAHSAPGAMRSKPKASNGDEPLSPLPVRQLSVLEKQMLQNARDNAQKNITKKQIVWGKEFTGTPFIASPAIVSFVDFELGNTYSCVFQLTNVSFTFNTFKLLPMKDEIRDLFELTFALPGRMSAGTSCDITIAFTPKTLAGIEDFIPFLAETGPFDVPIICSPKKVVIEVEPNDRVIDFGDVIMAEESTKSLVIHNRGSLDTSFVFKGSAIDNYHTMLDNSGDHSAQDNSLEQPRVLSFSKIESPLPQKSSVVVQIKYMPREAIDLDCSFTICFGDNSFHDIQIEIRGRGKDVSIYVERDVVDMKCCCLNTLYRGSISVSNRGKNAMRCEMKVPKEIQNHLEFVPALGFVQTSQPLSFQIKFKPLDTIFSDCAQHLNRETNEFLLPVRVAIPDQKMPVYFTVKAIVTSPHLSITPNIIDFGSCSTEEKVSVPISMKNEGILPLRFGFINLLPEIDVQPNDGFGTLLGSETRNLQIIFSPSSAIDYFFKILCRTDRNETYVISCSAVGTTPPLKFDAPYLKLASVALGDRTSKTVSLVNTTKSPQTFRFSSPDDHFITFHPTCGTVKPRESMDIEMKFEAPKSIRREGVSAVEEPPSPPTTKMPPSGKNSKASTKSPRSGTSMGKNAKASGSKDTVEPPPIMEEPKKITPEEERDMLYESWEKSEMNEPWSRHKTWDIPCVIQGYGMNSIYLQVLTTVVLSSLTLEYDGKEVDLIDFGDTPVNHHVTRTLKIHNRGTNDTHLVFRYPSRSFKSNNVLDPQCPFSIIPKQCRLGRSEHMELEIAYDPVTAESHNGYMIQILSTHTNNATIKLKGTGKMARFEIDVPQSSSPPYLDLDHVTLSSTEDGTSRQHITLSNKSDSVSIPFHILIPTERSTPLNKSGNSPFTALPASGLLKPGETSSVSLQFRPDYPSNYYFHAHCEVHYGGQTAPTVISLRSACWSPGACVIFDDNPRSTLVAASSDNNKRPTSAKKRPPSANAKKSSGTGATNEVRPVDLSTVVLPPKKPDARQLLGLPTRRDPFQLFQHDARKSALLKSGNLRDRYEYALDNTIMGQSHKFEFTVANSKSDSSKGEVECVMTQVSIDQGFNFVGGAPSPGTIKFPLELGAKKPITILFEPKESPTLQTLRSQSHNHTSKVTLDTNNESNFGGGNTTSAQPFLDQFDAKCEVKCTIRDPSTLESKTFLVVLTSKVFVPLLPQSQ